MSTPTLNDALIKAMENKIPDGTRLANVLIDILFIGKEAVYRRLRGEVPFTLNEAAIIARQLGISLDNTIGTKKSENALINVNIIDSDNPIITYEDNIRHYRDLAKSIKNLNDTEIGVAANLIPQIFYLRHINLSKFKLFKWIYQNDRLNSAKAYSDIKLSDKVNDLHKEYIRDNQHIKSTIYIFDNQVVNNFISDIRYFSNINLIEKKDVELLRNELLLLMDELEDLASKGKFKTGNSLQIYVSYVNFEATYGYLTSPVVNMAMFRLYTINSINSSDPLVYKCNKDFVLSLKKYSTLISESAEMQRIQFFNKQREMIRSF